MRVKICGITKVDQGVAITQLGATALGFICVPSSSRYVTSSQIKSVIQALPSKIDCIGVFAEATIAEITQVVSQTLLSGVQLHGSESPEFCQELREKLPEVEIIKAFRLKNAEYLSQIPAYFNFVDTFLLDAYHPQMLGGTGITIDWNILKEFNSPSPWLLAGGLTPENARQAIEQVRPHGIDLSSGVEKAPGNKDLDKVAQLFRVIGNLGADL
ncbi:phosphoribosylanthranilate isomerase [Merismopedia glauca]|uniref:N-(5'-phosphoribosyl)anthranilate isomerase n=1 Tax=Merismopedia glauca CCAP 1448/3 TaxID=1296344 RepID=A0A2T1BZS2_9CYAN|nr:phosphoribosylanthranilate isomerase [Merismopedia glauca]PSB01454.1 phosphoribosylanthranilate isomerase [Merismopedia glauca CCAP 1448/3]